MKSWMYAGTAQRRIRERRLEQRRRRDEAAVPAFRLLPRLEAMPAGGRSAGAISAESQIQPVDPRPFRLFLAGASARDYLEQRPIVRRSSASTRRNVSLDYGASYIPAPKPGNPGYYRRARRLPPVSPQRLAVYTVLFVLVAGLILVAGIHAATGGGDSATTQPNGQGMVEE